MPAQYYDLSYDLVSQAGILDDMLSGIKNFVVNNFDTAHPIKSIFEEFFIPGVIWTINPVLGIAYELANALNIVDWKKFWDSIIDPLENLVSNAKSSGTKPSDEDLDRQIQSITEQAANQSFKDNTGAQPTDDQIKALQKAQEALPKQASQETRLLVLSIRQSLMVKRASFHKTAGWASSVFRALFKFLGSKIAWVAGKIVRGLRMTTAAGAVAALVGNPKAQEGGGTKPEAQSTIASLIPISKSAPQELYDYHANNMTSTWIENGDISDASANIMDWILSAYPQLKKYEGDIEGSPAFRSTISQIMQRNKLGARGDGFYEIPPPSKRRMDIVGNIVSTFVDEHIRSLS